MIDLHIHSIYSDGTDTVTEILKKAQDLGLEYISITDHDKCRAYEEFKSIDIAKYYSGTIIPGIEIKCCVGDIKIEVLAYKIDTDSVGKWLEEFYKTKTFDKLQTKYFNKLYDICKNKGLKVADRENIAWNPQKDWASVTIHKEITTYPENEKLLPKDLWENATVFSKKYTTSPESEFYIDKSKDYPSLSDVIECIKNANGLVFLAHFYAYGIENQEDFLNNIIDNYKIDGIECFYSTFTNEQTNHLVQLCKVNNLYMSGGTDYHGVNKKDIKLGTGMGNLNISSNIIKEWI